MLPHGIARLWARTSYFAPLCKVMMLANDLLVIDSFVKLNNKLSQRATLRTGFVNRGIINKAQCYNGAMRPMYWNEMDRAGLGIEDN